MASFLSTTMSTVPEKSKLNRKKFKNDLPQDIINTKFMEVPTNPSCDFFTKLPPGFMDRDLKPKLPVESIVGLLRLPEGEDLNEHKEKTLDPADEYLVHDLDDELERRQAAFKRNIPWMEKPAHAQDGGTTRRKQEKPAAEDRRKVIEKSFELVKKKVHTHASNKRLIAKYEVPLSFELNERGEIARWIAAPQEGDITDSLLGEISSLFSK